MEFTTQPQPGSRACLKLLLVSRQSVNHEQGELFVPQSTNRTDISGSNIALFHATQNRYCQLAIELVKMYHVQGHHGRFLAGKTTTAVATVAAISLGYRHCCCCVLFSKIQAGSRSCRSYPLWRSCCSASLRTIHIVLNTQTLFLMYQGHLKRRHSGVWPALWQSCWPKIYYGGPEY